ncbi:hypothetical protein G6F24_018083 [Rhizopus arrhizus]|nr:hypothetical protein G6F24_018083 [Rhizopus arrhizus]
MARISPVVTSMITIEPPAALLATSALRSSLKARYWMRRSMLRVRSLPGSAARSRSLSTVSPLRLRITRLSPALPRSHSSNASSRPSWPRASMLVKPSTCAIASPCG